MTDKNDATWKSVSEHHSSSIVTAVTLPTKQNAQEDAGQTTTFGKKKYIEVNTHQQEDDQLSDSSLNFITPSPRSVANEIDDNENKNSKIEPSAIEISSDQRISTEELEIIMDKCPTKCEWFVETISYVRDLSTTKRLNRLVRLWFRIQELDNFRLVDGRNNEHKLSMINRPPFFKTWMQTHHTLKRKSVPELDPINEFLEQYQQWWSLLQPAWRMTLHSEPFTKASPARSDWSKLCRTGPNGLTLIILALAWMSSHIRSHHSLFSMYISYVEDATWAFSEMVQWIEGGCLVEAVTNLTEETDPSVASPSKPTKRGRQSNSHHAKSAKTVKRLRV